MVPVNHHNINLTKKRSQINAVKCSLWWITDPISQVSANLFSQYVEMKWNPPTAWQKGKSIFSNKYDFTSVHGKFGGEERSKGRDERQRKESMIPFHGGEDTHGLILPYANGSWWWRPLRWSRRLATISSLAVTQQRGVLMCVSSFLINLRRTH